jgi:ATP-dependent exoDNAse (exonuclease V) beta subunit
VSDHPLTPEQKAAVAARDRDVFLEAGAGTGKTRVLVERYCEAIRSDRCGVEEILAFTFTERAAAELRERVRRRLGALAAEARETGDELAADELARHARATERAWVMTIHGFCRRLLAAHPVAAGLDPRFRVLDDGEASRLRERAFTEALAELLSDGPDEVALAAAAYRPWRLQEMTIAAHTMLQNQGMREPRLPPVPDPVRTGSGDPAPLTPAEAGAAAVARAALEALLEGFHSRYEQLRAERAGLDFADLELRALELLRTSVPVRETWKGRFAHVLVDEFQDTNRVQLDLVEELRGPQTRVFVVGDEHQSIYRFRNADLEVFREQREAAASGPTELLALRGNFRSEAPVLAAVNQIGAAVLPGFEPLTWGRDPGLPPAAELLLTFEEGRGRDARNWREDGIELEPPPSEGTPKVVAEARHLARRLRQLVDDGEAERGEIVVLLRAFTHVDAFEEALRRAGLEPYVVGGRGYWSQQQVEDTVRLLAVISNPLDDEQLFGALASPACGVSPDALWLLRRAAGENRHVWPLVEWRYGSAEREPGGADAAWLEHVPAADAAALERFCAILASLRSRAPVLSLEALIEAAITEFGYDLALLARGDGRGRMANVRKLMRLAREFERHEGRDLAAFLAVAAESTRRDEREGMAAVRAEDHDGVRVMTVHAAKGLEFPVVAVPDLGRPLNAGHSWSDVVIGRPAPSGDGAQRFGMRLVFPENESLGLWELEPLNREERAASAEEACRLVYVAATRAQDRLILSGTFGPKDLEASDWDPGDSALKRLLPAIAKRGWAGADGEVGLEPPQRAPGASAADPGETRLRIEVSEPSPERAEWLREELPPPRTPAEDRAAEPPPLLDSRAHRVPVGHLSYSALAEYGRCGYRFYVERVLGVRAGAISPAATSGGAEGEGDEPGAPDELPEPADPTAEAAARRRPLAIGNAVHAALEWSAANGWRRPPEATLSALVAREGLAGDAAAEIRASVDAWLDSPLRRELEGWRIRSEVPFVLPLGGTVVRGVIDLLAEGPDGELCVIDFKTDALRGRPPAELGKRYEVQRRIYALAAAGTPEDPAAVRTVHVFLERASEPVAEAFGKAELDSARAGLEELAERMAGNEFEVTAEPSPAICFGCPAAARLCPRPAWRPSWSAPRAGTDPQPDSGAEPVQLTLEGAG